jgi:hypothetical protein
LTFSAQDIIDAAKTSVASVSPAKAFILQGKLETLEHLEKRQKHISKVLTEYCEAFDLPPKNWSSLYVKILDFRKGG